MTDEEKREFALLKEKLMAESAADRVVSALKDMPPEVAVGMLMGSLVAGTREQMTRYEFLDWCAECWDLADELDPGDLPPPPRSAKERIQ